MEYCFIFVKKVAQQETEGFAKGVKTLVFEA